MDREIAGVRRVEVVVVNTLKEWESKDGVNFLKNVGVKNGDKLLDFGCRVGHYSIPAAFAVGKTGKVYAIDKHRHSLEELKRKTKNLGLKNIELIKTSDQIDLTFVDSILDVVLLYDVLHYFVEDERAKLYQEIFRVLKQSGLLSIYPKHTAEDNPLMELQHHSSTDIEREIQSSGFQFERRYFGIISHDDGLNKGCVLNFRKSAGIP